MRVGVCHTIQNDNDNESSPLGTAEGHEPLRDALASAHGSVVSTAHEAADVVRQAASETARGVANTVLSKVALVPPQFATTPPDDP